MTESSNLTVLEQIKKEVQTLAFEQQQEVLGFVLFLNSRLHMAPEFSDDGQESRLRTAFLEVAKKPVKHTRRETNLPGGASRSPRLRVKAHYVCHEVVKLVAFSRLQTASVVSRGIYPPA